ncbi:MAG TPA: class I SAM-dependent methyltransferase [Isosphaeraceae bacterium]|nr:class I SAM-dependent methyltransferase [Isosphaeraceae bacterium]
MDSFKTSDTWGPYIARYRAGEWRDRIFRDMLLGDVAAIGGKPTILDIGCGEGLDGSVELQRSIAEAAGRFIGIEPDPAVVLGDHFTETLRCCFEQAPLTPGSIDLAYAVMVLEHLPQPQVFWDKLFEVLVPGGIFWGLTVDARHIFSRFSLWADRLRIKNLYMDFVLGRAADSGRYRNYPTYYRTNTPVEILGFARSFRSAEFINFSRVGQWSPYLPRSLRGIARGIDARSIRKQQPGTLLAVRVVK